MVYNLGSGNTITVTGLKFFNDDNVDVLTKAEFPSGFNYEGTVTSGTGICIADIGGTFMRGAFFNIAKSKFTDGDGGIYQKQ